MKLILACPTYGPVDPLAAKHLRGAIMHAAANGVAWLGDASPDRMKFDAARNAAVEAALRTEADAIFWVDSDVVLPTDAITNLVRAQVPFITGIYHQRAAPHWPLVAHYMPQRDVFNWLLEWPENVIAPVDGCGFGCVLTATSLLRQLTPPWFAFQKFSEDFDFCLKAKAVGVQLLMHTGVLCGHLADPVAVTGAQFTAQKALGLEPYLRPKGSAA